MARTSRDGVAAAAILACLWWIGGRPPYSGPVVATLTRTHGVHLSDPFALAIALALGWLVSRPARRPPARRPAFVR